MPSSSPCESLFSIARKCLDYTRNKTKNVHFEAQLLAKTNKFKRNKKNNKQKKTYFVENDEN